jgi:hypothetical protein
MSNAHDSKGAGEQASAWLYPPAVDHEIDKNLISLKNSVDSQFAVV